jgi:thiol:disulfide interchange protein
MKKRVFRLFLLSGTICLLILAGLLSSGEPAKGNRPAIYDTKADGKEQVAAALKQAQKENKRVLLKFGANWCGWCHLLSRLFHDDPEIAKMLKDNYVLVLIDVDKGHNEDVVKQYGNPTQHGLPVLVVLDKEGKQLTTQDTGALEDGKKHDPAKVMAFLKKWKP